MTVTEPDNVRSTTKPNNFIPYGTNYVSISFKKKKNKKNRTVRISFQIINTGRVPLYLFIFFFKEKVLKDFFHLS